MARADPAPTRIFLWENFGPTHADRLRALAEDDLGRAVVGLQYASRSHTYGWTTPVHGFTIETLCPDGASPMRLAFRIVRACLRHGRADIFLCHYQEWPVLLAAIALRLCGRRVFAMMESKFDDYSRRLNREWIKAAFLSPYHGALTASPRSRAYLRFLGVPPERIRLGYSTLSVARIRALAGAPPAPDGPAFAERDFVVVARLVPKKNLEMAIEAYAQWLAHTGGRRDLHLCGSGPLEPMLRRQVAALGLDARIHFHGFVQTEAVSRLLARALCLLLPSTEEQFGLVVIEAQALGVPVLVSTNAGAADRLVVPGHDGFLIDPAKPASCAALMAELSEDESRWRRFAAAARDGAVRGDARHFAAAVRALTEAEG